jgi:Ca2+-binding RTX toxin-like protein
VRRLALASSFVLVLCGVIVWRMVPAAAAITASVDAAGVLTITGDAESDDVVVRCGDDGNVAINGSDPETGAVPCGDITSILVDLGDGDDSAKLRYVTADTFTSLTSVSVELGAGLDYGDSHVWSTTTFDGGGGDQDTAQIRSEGDVALSDDAGDAGSEVVFVGVEHVAVLGSAASETIDGRDLSTDFFEILGRQGDDRILAGSARSTLLYAGRGDDALVGGTGRDTLNGGPGDDISLGRKGSDVFEDDLGTDRMVGGPGQDLFGLPFGRGNVYRGGPGSDGIAARFVLRVALGDERLISHGQARLRSIETASLTSDGGPMEVDASGFSGDVFLGGSSEDDVLIGGAGDDGLFGSTGRDRLVGGPGDDRLDGGPGADDCDGGSGRNVNESC